ncbi:hypothetical protein SAMN04488001_0699 [Litoreibacter albidus]|uniref:Uncharacterized protein n=2 Tax=Litoreibacter albidus TaxID=670155 RepID=A0A1H2S6E9_9RHOB|nr:hypothetical protein SAMN04488001_0699 [Litoreibacter albidus]
MLRGGHLALGITVGVLGTILVFFLLEMFSSILPSGNEYWAALIGALSGGAFSMLALTLEHQHNRAEIERLERLKNLTHAYSLFEHLGEIVSNVGFLRNHINICLEDATNRGVPFPIFAVLPIAGTFERTRVPHEAKSFLISQGQSELYNLIGNLDLQASGEFDAFERSQLDRARVLELAKLLRNKAGDWAIEVSPENEEEVSGRAFFLSEQIERQSKQLEALLKQSLKALHGAVSVIRSSGNSEFGFAIKDEYIQEFGKNIEEW